MTGIIFLPRLVFIIYLLKCFKCCIKTLRSTHIYLHTVTSLRHILILLDQSLSKHWKNRKRIRVMAISTDYSGKLGTVFESLKTLAVFEFKIYHTDVSGSKKFRVPAFLDNLFKTNESIHYFPTTHNLHQTCTYRIQKKKFWQKKCKFV